MSGTRQPKMLTRYKAWANELVFSMVGALPGDEAIRRRATPEATDLPVFLRDAPQN
jgi:hypothetical protein